MRIIVLSLLFVTVLFSAAYSQVFSGKTASENIKMEQQYVFTAPPILYVDMKFSDDNANGIIESEENAELTLEISNRGNGSAQGLKILLHSEVADTSFKYVKEISINEIKPGATEIVTIKMNAGFSVKTNEHKIDINVTEFYGYDMDPATLILNTLEYQKPQIVFSGMEIFDNGEGTTSIVTDGQLQAGEMVKTKLVFQNIGNNIAINSKYNVYSNDPNLRVVDGAGDLGTFNIGEVKEVWVTISPNKRVVDTENLPIFVTVSESVGKGSLIDFQLPLALNQRPPKTETLAVKADFEKMQKQVARFEYKSDRYTSNIASKSIEAVPVTKSKRTDAIAIVIGVEDYKNMPPAPYAEKDAEIMSLYFKNVLGVNNVITHLSDEVTGFFFINIFDEKTGKLAKMINKGETEVFVYYSGHGIPEKDGKDVYLFPSDGSLEQLDMMGYSLNKLYKNLDALGAKNVTVIIDACFTGSTRTSSTLVAENISNTKGTIIKPREVQPWQTNTNFRVFTSSSDEQTSLGFDETGTGLFTYYIAIGLQGDADINQDKLLTVGELRQFVTQKVSETSVKIRGEQTPQFYGTDDFIMVEF